MHDKAGFTFISCESGATPKRIGAESRKKIRSQVMRSSWSKKKSTSSKRSGGSSGTRPTDAPNGVPPGVASVSDILDPETNKSDHEPCLQTTITPRCESPYMSPEVISAKHQCRTLHDWERKCNNHKTRSQRCPLEHSRTPSHDRDGGSDIEDSYRRNYGIDWINSDYLDLPAGLPSCCGVDPFGSSVAPINLRMHSYLQYYLEHVVPVLHPYEVQTALLKQNLLNHLNRSPLILYSALSIAAMRVDNYCNKYDELLLYSKWTDSQLPVPHSFRFKTKALHLLLHAMHDPSASTHDIVFALICLVTYELLVDNYKEARAHLRGLRQLLQSYGGLQNILRAEMCIPGTISRMRNVVREMEKHAERAGEDAVIQPIPDETALCRRLAAYSRFPTLIGKAPPAPEGVDWFAVENESAGIHDEMAATECFWHMGCRNDKNLALKALIGIDSHDLVASASEVRTQDKSCYSVVHAVFHHDRAFGVGHARTDPRP